MTPSTATYTYTHDGFGWIDTTNQPALRMLARSLVARSETGSRRQRRKAVAELRTLKKMAKRLSRREP